MQRLGCVGRDIAVSDAEREAFCVGGARIIRSAGCRVAQGQRPRPTDYLAQGLRYNQPSPLLSARLRSRPATLSSLPHHSPAPAPVPCRPPPFPAAQATGGAAALHVRRAGRRPRQPHGAGLPPPARPGRAQELLVGGGILPAGGGGGGEGVRVKREATVYRARRRLLG